ncbi:hypothetical protein ACQ4PT_001244 [Festuca glaucescens]
MSGRAAVCRENRSSAASSRATVLSVSLCPAPPAHGKSCCDPNGVARDRDKVGAADVHAPRRAPPPVASPARGISGSQGISAQGRRLDGSPAPPAPAKEAPKEPKFSCPVCMNELVNASSTTCGHIFCHKCIRASIHAQTKCPTCRRTLSLSDFHRVYLPTMD